MTLLDDYEARYKLRGVAIVSVMLQHVPKALLKRTGVDGLIRSVRHCSCFVRCSMTYFHLHFLVTQHLSDPPR